MKFQFYMRGQVVPAIYDYDLTVGGNLYRSRHSTARSSESVAIVLENEGYSPTKAQMDAIASMKRNDPKSETKLFFSQAYN